jgi:ankyrin repeat protein
MHYAVEAADNEIVAALLDKGADVNASDETGATPLLLAAGKSVVLVTSLVRRGANVNAKDLRGWTPLMAASGSRDPQTVEFLIANGADVSAKDNDGWTARKQALLSGCDGIVEKIKQAGGVE